jgi:hypothetical protein
MPGMQIPGMNQMQQVLGMQGMQQPMPEMQANNFAGSLRNLSQLRM